MSMNTKIANVARLSLIKERHLVIKGEIECSEEESEIMEANIDPDENLEYLDETVYVEENNDAVLPDIGMFKSEVFNTSVDLSEYDREPTDAERERALRIGIALHDCRTGKARTSGQLLDRIKKWEDSHYWEREYKDYDNSFIKTSGWSVQDRVDSIIEKKTHNVADPNKY